MRGEKPVTLCWWITEGELADTRGRRKHRPNSYQRSFENNKNVRRVKKKTGQLPGLRVL